MKQVASAIWSKALTASIVTSFITGFVAAGGAAYGQQKKTTPALPAGPAGTTQEQAAAVDKGLQLPGVFKELPGPAQEITQKGAQPTSARRNSLPDFSADFDKVTGTAKLRRMESQAAVIAAVTSRPGSKPEQKVGDKKVAKNEGESDANKHESKKILIPAELANVADKYKSDHFHATAYCLKGRTATGEVTRSGFIAADPKILPLGTLVKIEAGKYSGVYKVADTGGSIKGNKIDIYVPTYREAKLFGRQKIKVTVLNKGGKGKKD